MSDEKIGLKAEYDFFDRHRRKWFREHGDKYVLIHKQKVLGFYDDYATALNAGVAKAGVRSEFLIQQVCIEEPVFVIY